MRKFKLGIIGCGNMSTAIWEGILDAGLACGEDIIVSDLDDSRLQYASDKGLNVTKDNKEVILSDYIIYAVKPQVFSIVAESIGKIDKNTVAISIMAGISVEKIKKLTGAIKVVRVMPNTPCMIKKGVSALAFDNVSKAEKEYVFSLFASIGDALEVSEDKFDAVTSVSGSGPAYIYTFLEGMIKGGMNGGLSYDEAKMLAVATMQGAAEMVRQKDTPINELINAVCSKGGTTIEAVNVFTKHKLTDIIVEGMDACRERSEELSKL